MNCFVGRAYELEKMKKINELKSSALIVVSGRRRIGKSRLVEEFAKSCQFYKFSGLAPRENITAQNQRDQFMQQFAELFGLPVAGVDDWSDLFNLLAKQLDQKKKTVILFDEITWMAHSDRDFLGKLKNAWDDQFSKFSKLTLFLCGSVSAWIEENIINSSAFHGRITMHIRLKELPLSDCGEFLSNANEHYTAYEKFKLLSITGGVPRYLELINHQRTAEENIRDLFFTKESALYDEYQKIFKDIYGRRSNTYQSIVEQLVNGALTQEEISRALDKARSGDLSKQLDDLVLGGFVSRDYAWQLKTGKVSNLSKYRLSDNYLRFALKYIQPNQARIEKDRFENRSIRTLPGWDSIMGLQFENLVLNNHAQVIKQLGILPEDIIFDNAFFQRKTARTPGCQVDYMVQTRHDTVFVCEVKFQREPIGLKIIGEMKDKLQRLKVPKHISKRPILIHVNGVKEPVVDSQYFTKIIDFSELLS